MESWKASFFWVKMKYPATKLSSGCSYSALLDDKKVFSISNVEKFYNSWQ
jgi:hypothetical protein